MIICEIIRVTYLLKEHFDLGGNQMDNTEEQTVSSEIVFVRACVRRNIRQPTDKVNLVHYFSVVLQ